MSVEYKETGLTEEEILKLPKVSRNSIFIGEERVYLKISNKNIVDIGSKELLRDINNTFCYSSSLNFLLFIALCGNKKLTKFNGDPYKKVQELSKTVTDVNTVYSEYIESDDKSEFPLYNKRHYRNNIYCRANYENKLKQFDNTENRNSNSYLTKMIRDLKRQIDNTTNDILDVLLKGDYSIFGINIDPYAFGKSYDNDYEYYNEVLKNIKMALNKLTPVKDNNTPFLIKTCYLKDMSTVTTNWEITDSKFNNKKGEVELHLSNTLQHKEFKFNMYTDDFNNDKLKNNITLPILLSIILNKYKKENLAFEIVMQTLENNGYYFTSHGNSGKYFDIYSMIESSQQSNLKIFKGKEATNNLNNLLKLLVINIDKIYNNENKNVFETHIKFLVVPNKNKWKMHEAFRLTKQTYNKFINLNKEEQRNYLYMLEIIIYRFPDLYSEPNLHKLFDDDFIMADNSHTIGNAFSFKATTKEVLNFTFSDFRKMVNYIGYDTLNRQRIHSYAVNNLYKDYIDFASDLVLVGYRTRESVNLTPYSLKLEHDIVTDEYLTVKNELDDLKLQQKYSNKLDLITTKVYSLSDGTKIKFLPADTTEKLKQEGKKLSHCVGMYASNIINDKCLILLARKVDDINKSWYTVEVIITKYGYRLGQQQSLTKYELPKKLKDELVKDIKKLNKQYSEDVA
ncbi:hypothetical protein [Staphylococcus phage SAP6]|nr:hypothetical protein [Staphylococcus phage StAP1]WAW12112.1 hypothetical protein [Staphylococcus phage SAP6]